MSDLAESIKTQESEKHLTTTLMLPTEVLNFSVSSQETFKSNNINYLVELAVKTEEELPGMPDFESQNLFEVKDVLFKMGLQLRMNVDRPPAPEKLEELEKQAQKVYEKHPAQKTYYPLLTPREERVLKVSLALEKKNITLIENQGQSLVYQEKE